MYFSIKINDVVMFSRLLLNCLPLLEQYALLTQFYLNEQVASFRVTCKILYLQLNVFLDLAANGFCVPKDLDLEEGEMDESGEKTDKGGMGLAEGEGTKDVSDRIESEDQLEEAKPMDQEQKDNKDDKTCKEEEKGIEMSEDFDSKLQDIEKHDDDEEHSDDDENNEDLDKEMGETGEEAEQLDKEIWGDDEDERPEANDEPGNENEEEGTGEQIGDKEMGAKDDNDNRKEYDDDNDDHRQHREEEKKEINEINEPKVDESQIDPYHGKHQPAPEPESFDLPEDLNLDDDDKENDGGEEANPFDIDEMKDPNLPQEKENTETEKEDIETEKEIEENEDDSEDENENNADIDKQNENQEMQEDLETNKEKGDGAETETKNEGDEQKDEKEDEEKLQEKATPSTDDASKQFDAADQIDEAKNGSRDTVAQPMDGKDQQEPSTENTQEDNSDKGTGYSQSMQQKEGHSGSSKQDAVPALQQNNPAKSIEKRKNLNQSNEDRSLLDRIEPKSKRLKTIYTLDEIARDEKEDDISHENDNRTEVCQHIKDSEQFDDYTFDGATEDQAKQQASNEEKEDKEEKDDEVLDVEMHQDNDNAKDEQVMQLNPEKVSQATDDKHKEDSSDEENNAEIDQTETIEIEGEYVKTVTVERGNEPIFNTRAVSLEDSDLGPKLMERERFEVEKMLKDWTQTSPTEEATAVWNHLCSITDMAARDLSEKLRLVLEPTQRSRLKGDYKTGKRINMRKIIPYIASQFRKDKIWLRRTKPSKRDYQIILALDDSKSMQMANVKEMAFESLSLISKAMTYLEVGQLSVLSYGEEVKILHPLAEPFTEQSGSR